jgi:phosphate transport system substrate-binding protein
VKLTRTGGLVALAVAGSMAISACGSDSNSSSNVAATTKASSAAATGSAAGSSSTGAAAGSGAAAACAAGSLNGAGSSFQDPMEQQWSKDFGASCSGAKINYNPAGSGAGIQQFGAGTIDYAGSDVPMKADEQAAADKWCGSPAWHLPITAGGVGVTWNLPGVTDLTFSAATLADIFDGKVKTWNDAEIKTDNPTATLPSLPISVVYRADSSGTNAVFTGYLDAAAKSSWTLGTGKTIQWPTGTGAQKSAGVAAKVKQVPGAITYVEQAFATQNQLPLAKIKNGSTGVALSTASVTAAIAGDTISGTGNNLVATVNYAPTDPAAYPISTLSYVIVCSKYPSGETSKVATLKGYLNYAATGGQAAASGLGFAPLPSTIAGKVTAAIAAIS